MIYKYWINGQNTWLVDFNPKKTKALIISNNTNIPELNIRFNDESVELVDNHKHLGVTFVSDGNWTVHIENIARSALKQVNVLLRLKFLSYIYQTSTRICMWSVGWVLWTNIEQLEKNLIRSDTNCNSSDKIF